MSYNNYAFIFSNLGPKETFKCILNRIISLNHYYILNRSLTSLPDETKIRREISIKKIDDQDLKEIIKMIKLLDPISKKEIIYRIIFYKDGFKNCYVGKTKEGGIAYIQWLVYSSENSIIKKHFHNLIYPLREKQVMVENVLTFPKFRGLNLMPAITTKLLNIAKENGCKNAIEYIRKDRIAALNENMRLGFKITKIITGYKFMGKIIRTL